MRERDLSGEDPGHARSLQTPLHLPLNCLYHLTLHQKVYFLLRRMYIYIHCLRREKEREVHERVRVLRKEGLINCLDGLLQMCGLNQTVVDEENKCAFRFVVRRRGDEASRLQAKRLEPVNIGVRGGRWREGEGEGRVGDFVSEEKAEGRGGGGGLVRLDVHGIGAVLLTSEGDVWVVEGISHDHLRWMGEKCV